MSDDTFDERVAIVGMHLRLPAGIDTCDGLWRLLMDGRDVFTRGPVDGRRVAITARIDDDHWFAPEHFGITDFEASLMDPQHRMLLEMSWECLESAPPGKEAVTGVFSSCSPSAFFQEILLTRPGLWERNYSQIAEGNHPDYVATRIAYRLGLTGPAIHVGTGCSSSLVGLSQATQALNAFQCDRALVAAASLHSPSSTGYEAREGGIYSPDGYCRPFSDSANGTVPGSGAAVVLLKRLEDALADGDPVHAVILGSAVNNDGDRKVGFAAPSVEGQAECVTAALDVADVSPAEVSYVEAHGTGTDVGDPIELRALARAYGADTPDGGRFVGSVKANVGHCDVAAGLVGLVKAALVLRRRTIPPQPHAAVPTRRHDWGDGSLRLPAEAVDLDAHLGPAAPITAGVSSLGVGGTNAHVLLRDARSVIGAAEESRRHPSARPTPRIPGRRPYDIAQLGGRAAPTPAPATAPAASTPESAAPAAPVAPVAPAAPAAPVAVTDERLLALFSEYTAEPVTSVDDDFFDQGGDSMGLLYLLDELNTLSDREITFEAFTDRPTVAFVREHLAAAARPDVTGAGDAVADASDDLAAVQAEITERLRPVVPAAHAAAAADGPVLLTGASGFVGTFVLAELLARGRDVVCLLRGGAPERRAELVRRLVDFELWREEYDARLAVEAGDVARPHLGLGPAAHDRLAERVSLVVHAAAWVNHLYPYDRLAPANAHSAAAVLAFAAAGRRKAVTLVSTSAVFDSPAYPPGTEIGNGPLAALPPASDGYSRSKAVAEAYVARAAELGVPAAVVRVPNVFGDRRSFRINAGDAIWSWTRAIMLTGRYPSSFDAPGDETFQALPADLVARLVVDAAHPDGDPGCRFVNAVPNLVCSSRSYLAALRAVGHRLDPVPDGEWYARVASLDARKVWVAGVAGRRAGRPAPQDAQRLHRFLPDGEPEVAELVNAHALWLPDHLVGYLGRLGAGEVDGRG